MLDRLLERGGRASIRGIAAQIPAHDEQLHYYEQIVKNMPGRVLASHGIVGSSALCGVKRGSLG